jgi:hypoxanthine phosphoribosyltransferase
MAELARVCEVLFTQEEIARRVEELGKQLTAEFASAAPIFVAVLQGAVIFYSDLIRSVRLNIACDMVWLASYHDSSSSSAEPEIIVGPRQEWRDRDILFVDEIIDTGRTARRLLQLARERGAATARLCTLLDKPARRVCEIRADYVGFTLPDLFVVGYGLDYQGAARNLPYIGWIEEESQALPGRDRY